MTDDPPSALSAFLIKLRPIDKGVYGAVVVLVLLAAFGAPVWKLVDAPLALGLEWDARGSEAVDPWGRPLVTGHRRTEIGRVPAVWSVGPNGVDELGGGDDVQALLSDDPRRQAYRIVPVALLLLGLGLAGSWAFLSQLYRLRSERLVIEAVRAAGLAVPVGALLGAVGIGFVLVADRPGGPIEALREQLVIPLPIAVVGSSYVFSCLVIFWIRLAQPLEGAEPAGPTA